MPTETTQPQRLPKIYATDREIAEIFPIPRATLQTKRSRGGGPPFRRVGRRVLYRIDEVEAWLDQHPVEGR